MIIAYIDPGTGALVWQMIVAAFVGFLFYLRQTRQWIVAVFMDAFRKIFGRGQKPPDAGIEIPPSKVESETGSK
jgi:hypothetical protein